jgi:hypothetical protein
MMACMDAEIPFVPDADGVYHLTTDELLQWKVTILADVADVAASFSESMVLGLNQSAAGLEQEADSEFKRGIVAGLRVAAGQIYKAAAQLRSKADPPESPN